MQKEPVKSDSEASMQHAGQTKKSRLTGFETTKVSWLSATSSFQTSWCNKHTRCYTHTHQRTHRRAASVCTATSSCIRKSCCILSRKSSCACERASVYVPVVIKAAVSPPSCWGDKRLVNEQRHLVTDSFTNSHRRLEKQAGHMIISVDQGHLDPP